MQVRARAFLTDLRGSESTASLSNRLGYATDLVAEWEAGTTWPTAAETFRVCGARRIDVRAALRRFDPQTAHAFAQGEDNDVARWLAALVAGQDIRQIAARIGRPSATLRRWLTGQVRPNLPEMLEVLEEATGRSEDLLQILRPTAHTPSPAPGRTSTRGGTPTRVLEALERARTIRSAMRPDHASEEGPSVEDEDEVTVEIFGPGPTARSTPPPTHTVWRAIASRDHRTLGPHRPGWLEARTGLDADTVQAALESLAASGHARFTGQAWEALDPPSELSPLPDDDTDTDPLTRLARRRGAQVVVPLSHDDLARVRRLSRRTRPELEAIAASCARPETLALVRVDLGVGP